MNRKILHPLIILVVQQIVGISCYENVHPSYFELATHSRYFVDKTALLKTFFEHRMSLITCPKDFGKSTNLDMIRQFFQLNFNKTTGQKIDKKTTRNYRLFTNESLNLQIARNANFIEQHLGEYPVLYLNFGNPRGNSSETIVNWMIKQIRKIFLPYDWLYHQIEGLYRLDPFREHLLVDYDKILNGTADIWDIGSGMELLLEFIVKHFHTDIMIFVDAFDAPIDYAIGLGIDLYDIDHVIRMMSYDLLTGSEFVTHVIIVGVTRSFQEWDFENFERHDFLNDHPYAEYFGFTEQEVDKLLSFKNAHHQRTKIKQFFNGYRIRNTQKSLHNPKLIIRYLETNSFQNIDHDDTMIPALTMCLRHEKFFAQISTLLSDKRITTIIQPQTEGKNLTVFELMSQDKCYSPETVDQNLLSLFIDYGYLNPAVQQDTYEIPNKIMENKLRNQFHCFFQNFYAINITNAHLGTSISEIFNSENTTDNMLTTLADSLNQLIKRKKKPERFTSQSIVIGALWYNLGVEPDIKMKIIINEGENSNHGIDLTKSTKDGKTILLMIAVTFKKTLKDAIQQAKTYVSQKYQDTGSFHLVTYLGIHIDQRNRIEVGRAEKS